jgi:hypothetical protein
MQSIYCSGVLNIVMLEPTSASHEDACTGDDQCYRAVQLDVSAWSKLDDVSDRAHPRQFSAGRLELPT